MNVTVYTDYVDSSTSNTFEHLKVWEGNLDCIPREGELISIFDGWGSFRVKRLTFDLPTNSVEIIIQADISGEIAKKLREDNPNAT